MTKRSTQFGLSLTTMPNFSLYTFLGDGRTTIDISQQEPRSIELGGFSRISPQKLAFD